MTDQRPLSTDRARLAMRFPTSRAGRAGFLAALVMLGAQLLWRLNWSHNGVVQAFPEFIVAAIARLTPLSIFGAATENYGSLAKKSLFVGVLIGIVVIGFVAGIVAERLSRKAPRLVAGVVVAGALLLFTLVVVMPIAHLGLFAADSSYTGDILLQLGLTFALFAVAWTGLSSPRLAETTAPAPTEESLSRRAVLGRAAWRTASAAAMTAVGVMTWRLINPSKPRVNLAQSENTVDDIVATQRARQGLPVATPTPTPVPEAAVREVASLNADVALAQDDYLFSLFSQLDAEERLTPILTATPDFYHVSKNLVDPTVDEGGWKLTVTGLVDKDIELTYDQAMQRATTKKITTLCCISNELNGDLIGTAEWQGFSLAELLNEAGVGERAIDVKFHCADDYEDSITIERALDPDTLVVVGMNGEPLADDHGFPARIIVPGIYGMKNVKWLERIEIVEHDFKGYWQTRGWSDPAPYQIWGRIDYPGSGEKPAVGQVIAAGVASAGDRDVSQVEVSLDDGETWANAYLEPALNPPFTWVRWAYPIDAQEGDYKMRIRATDGLGEVATSEERPPLPDGATGWPRRSFKVEN